MQIDTNLSQLSLGKRQNTEKVTAIHGSFFHISNNTVNKGQTES